jgi:zinc protease
VSRPDRSAEPPPLDRTRPPRTGRAPSVRLPDVHRFTLSGGLRVIFVQRRGVPVVNLQLLVLGGSAALAPGEAGLASLTASLLDEGSGTRSALEIAGALEQLGATLYCSAGLDANEVELNVVSPRLPETLELLADVLLGATFPEFELDRIRSERLARIVQELDDPRAVATFAFARVLFGEAHPWGSPLLGTAQTLERLCRDDVVRYYEQHVHPGSATLIVAGEADPARLQQLLERTLGPWAARPSSMPALPDPPQVTQPRVHIVDRPDAPQSELRIGRVAVARSTPDYFALTVMNTILGGAFTSRLNSKLREEKGYTYGAGSGFSMRRVPGPFVAQAAVHTPATHEALADVLREIRRMGEEDVEPAELERAKRYVALRLPQRFESVSDITARLSELVLYDLPDDYFASYVDRIMAVTAEDVRSAAERHLDPARMVAVVAGDRQAIEGPLGSLGIGPVEILPSLPWAMHSEEEKRC